MKICETLSGFKLGMILLFPRVSRLSPLNPGLLNGTLSGFFFDFLYLISMKIKERKFLTFSPLQGHRRVQAWRDEKGRSPQRGETQKPRVGRREEAHPGIKTFVN
jgi:hypothetical protein